MLSAQHISGAPLFRLALLTVVLVAGVRVTALDKGYQKDVETWRAQHEINYRKEYVPLAGLFPLHDGWNTAGSAPDSEIMLPKRLPASVGRFQLDGKLVRFEPKSGVTATIRGLRVGQTALIRNDEDKDGADEIIVGDVAFWVHISGERPTIRVRDPKGDPARTFRGFRWFDIDESYRVKAQFIKDAAPRELHTANQLGDEDVMTTEGVAEFTVNGQTVRLRPMTTRPNRLWFIFRDGTSGQETYETARFLYADLMEDGTTILDFNEAYNPPCAFNPYTTCPIPLPENRLQVRILAGERAYAK